MATPWLPAFVTDGISAVATGWCSVFSPHRTDFFFGSVDASSLVLSLLMRPDPSPLFVFVIINAFMASSEAEYGSIVVGCVFPRIFDM